MKDMLKTLINGIMATRTHYDTRKTGKITYTFDGILEGKETIDISGDGTEYLIKLSDHAPTLEECYGGKVIFSTEEEFLINEETSAYIEENIWTYDDLVFVALKDTELDFGVLTQGVWVIDVPKDSVHFKSLEYFGRTGELKKLDEKYLPDSVVKVSDIPQSDWNQNDPSLPDYIKNRTHYEEIIPEQVIFDGYLVEGNSEVTVLFNEEINYGAIVDIYFNNELFSSNTVTVADGVLCALNGMINVYFYTSENTIEIFNYLSSGQIKIVIKEFEKIKQLDEKFISYKPGLKFRTDDHIINGAEIFNDYENNKATGNYSHAEGCSTTASGHSSHTEGDGTVASGMYSHAEGDGTIASGWGAHAEGSNTTASGGSSHAEGESAISSGYSSHAEGDRTYATGRGSHAEGNATTASGDYSHAEGGNFGDHTVALDDITVTLKKYQLTGEDVLVKGSTAYGKESHAEGTQTLAYGNSSHTEGYQSKAFGKNSHAEGLNTVAFGESQHVEGCYNIVDNTNFKEKISSLTREFFDAGVNNVYYASSEYIFNNKTGKFSLVNPSTKTLDMLETSELIYFASRRAEADIMYYKVNTNFAFSGKGCRFDVQIHTSEATNKYAHIVGNGKDDTDRSNAHTLDWEGNAWFAGDVLVGGTSQDDTTAVKLATETYVDTKVADLVNSAPETLDTLGELATALQENADVVETLNEAITNKADKSDVAQSDWNVNDETDPAFIKNRPFYGDEQTTSITHQPDEFMMGTHVYFKESPKIAPFTFPVKVGDVITVNYQGTDYELTAVSTGSSDRDIQYGAIGNELGFQLDINSTTYEYGIQIHYSKGIPTMPLTISFTTGNIKKIDPKYLPDDIGGSTIYDNTTKTNLYLKTDGFDSTLTSDDVKGSIQGLPIGSIIEWSSLTPPNNYLICDGSWVSQAVYADLYAVIGHTYDGDTSVEGSFRLPNRCGKVGVGYDADNTNFNALGKTGGEETHTLTIAEMPTHSHNNARGVKAASPGSKDAIDTSWATGSAFASNIITNNTGGGNAHNNLQPYETTIFVIKYKDGNMFSDEYGGVVIDNLNSTSTKDVLSAYQGKVLNDTKLDKSGGTIDGNLTVNGDYLYYGTAGYVGSNGSTSLHIQGTASNYISVKTTNGKGITISGTDGVYPSDTDTLQLGAGNKRWNVIYCKSGSVSTSDRTHKDNIADIDNKYMQLFDKLKPVTFEYNYETSDRTHVGFISQDVKESMDEIGLTDLEFAGYCRDEKKLWNDEEMCWEPVLDEEGNPTYIYSLRYSEFIALNTKMIQLNKAKIAEQEAEIDTLKSELSELKDLVNKLMDSKEE